MVPRKILNGVSVLSAFVIASALAVSPAEAIPIIKFDQGQSQTVQDGTLAWAGGDSPLIGADIGFSIVTGLGDLAGMGLACNPLISGFGNPCMLLDFTTGEFTGSSVSDLTWGSDPFMMQPVSFVVTLTDANALGGLIMPAGTELLTGTALLSASMTGNAINGFTASLIGIDVKDPVLLDFFFDAPIPTDFRYVNTTIVLDTTGVSVNLTDGFMLNGETQPIPVSDADINNTPIDLPEPGSALVLLLGLGSLAAYRRRRS